ncbi:MAG: DUF4932 domain-containing protein [Candidatus Aminicenantales bacterium]
MNMHKLTAVAGGLSALLLAAGPLTVGADILEKQIGPKVWIRFSKNLSVLHVLVLLTPSRFEREDLFPHSLAKAARDYFKDFRAHPAVEMTDRIFKPMWYFPFNYLAFILMEFPEPARLRGIELPSEFEQVASLKAMAQDYVELAARFYRETNFQGFWDSHREELTALVNKAVGLFRTEAPASPGEDGGPKAGDISRLLENFYGGGADCYDLVPCPFMQSSATHTEVRWADGRTNYLYLQGGEFDPDVRINFNRAFHEFGHCFVEPVTQKYAADIQKLDHLYVPLKPVFEQLGYRDWNRAFNEHLITAGQLHLMRKAFGEAVMADFKEKEIRSGFKLLDRFYGHLEDYDRNRQTFPNLESFLPRILDELSRLACEPYQKPGGLGVALAFRSGRLTVTKVMPGGAFKAAGVREGDILAALAGVEIGSLQDWDTALEQMNRLKEKDILEIAFVRSGERISRTVAVPFVTDYRYVEVKR